MSIAKDPAITYIPIVKPEYLSRSITLSYIPQAEEDVPLTLHVFIDGSEDLSLKKPIQSSNYGVATTVTIPGQEHGVHDIGLAVGTVVNEEEVLTEQIVYQAAWASPNNDNPIIWIGSYDETIINYETSYIKFMVYDPQVATQGEPATIILYKENVEVSQMSVLYSDTTWASWDISTIYTVGENNYSIVCRMASADIQNFVTTVGSRDLGLVAEDSLMLNYTCAGRVNTEVSSQRILLKNQVSGRTDQAVLSGFNWKNNGWNNDGPDADGVDNGSYLTIANGASVLIPFQSITLNSGTNYSFEMRFRIRNVQEYSTLVQTLPMYFYDIGDGTKSSDSKLLSEIQSLGLTVWKDEWGNMVTDEEHTQKIVQTEKGVVCKWLSDANYGLCIGSQEAYFKTPKGVVSVRYKEDEVINIAVVVSSTESMVYIYLNGILSGADSLPEAGSTGAFNITNNFTINSRYCDIDLYRFRVYQYGLSMPNVIHNYLSDIHSIKLYDQNQLTSNPTELSYDLLVRYNNNHPDEPTMPYTIWKVTEGTDRIGEKLPFFKGDKVKVDITFINPPLDRAFENGEIDEWYYYTHCPSFKATGVNIDVQGTSSQGYPRRNYKTKFKEATSWTYYNLIEDEEKRGSLFGKSVTKAYTVLDKDGVEHTVSKKWHVDTENIGTNKFTWKIDYMESSGSYNTGFANLMGNLQHPLYTKHPLSDIKVNGESIFNAKDLRTTVYGFPVLTFHEYATSGNNPTNSRSTYEYIGRYNLNLDKGSNEYYGFEVEKEHPYLDNIWYEYKDQAVIDPNTGEPQIDGDGNPVTEKVIDKTHEHPWVADIAECWELEDNQGTWCSFKYPSAAARALGFKTKKEGKPDQLEVMSHFEYRYSKFDKQLDAIGAEGNYDGVTTDPKIIAEIGTTDAEKSAYVYRKYRNLEKVFNWVDSTDPDNATDAQLSAPSPVWKTPVAYTTGATSEGILSYIPVIRGTPFDPNQTYYLLDGTNYVEQTGITEFAEDNNGNLLQYYIYDISYYNTVFTHDTAGYRIEKFRNELEDHFDKEYCLIYYIMTELLLCYDSRGKNMMLASFGPQKAPVYEPAAGVTVDTYLEYWIKDENDKYTHPTGDYDPNETYYDNMTPYVWYPIFYDIDTQLGLNNSGAYLWDYDADVSKDGLFSTPTSVLWNNLWRAFENDIKNKYRVLRGLDDGSNVVNSLTYDNIAGAYECTSSTFKSLAMAGLRPIIAIGLDEYYKYFATTTASGVGYFDTKGDLIKEASPTYAYACQGDKILTTELLLRNRLNYIDSWWLGGDYYITQVKASELQCRVSANRFTLTSDNYIDVSNDAVAALIAGNSSYNTTNVKKGDYPVAYYDSRPGYKLKPFLKQYVSFFTDEIPSNPVKYNADPLAEADGVWTNVSPSIENTYKTQPETPNEQLNYIPGLDYLSSLGDLSTSYISEFSLRRGKRLLDLRLGSDAPGYKNAMIKSGTIFNLSGSKSDSGKKSLLQFVNLTGLTQLDKTIDFSGSEKLREFRALNTQIPRVDFADGAPLDTVHLPNTITVLKLVENKNLTHILDSRPTVAVLNNGVLAYEPAENYAGLYLEDITDYTAAKADTGHTLNTLIIEGGGLGYDSYKILENLKNLKLNAVEDRTLQVGLTDVKWTPYTKVEQGDSYIAANREKYFRLNDHSMFDPYEYTTISDWNEQVLNEEIYIYDETADKDTITDLSLFDLFLAKYREADEAIPKRPSQFSMRDATGDPSVPTITGTVFVNNINAAEEDWIDETSLTDVYKKKWPNLTIQAAHIKTANLCKYVRVYDNGKIETLTVERTKFSTPLHPTGNAPTQTYYDFKGWSTENPSKVENPTICLQYNSNYTSAEDMYIETTAWDALTFSQEESVITFYAIFELHAFDITFVNGDGTEYVEKVIFNTVLKQPSLTNFIPYKDSSSLDFDKKYVLEGWSDTANGEIVPLSSMRATRNYKFYPIWKITSVYSEPLGEEYFKIVTGSYTDVYDPATYSISNGLRIEGLNDGIQLKGKITLPVRINDVPIVIIDKLYNNPDITHIFFDRTNGENLIRAFGSQTFINNTNLVYIDFPTTLRNLAPGCFINCANLGRTDNQIDLSNTLLHSIQEKLFASNYLVNFDTGVTIDFKFPNTIRSISDYAYYYTDSLLTNLTIGSLSKPINNNIILPTGTAVLENYSQCYFDTVTLYVTQSVYNYLQTTYEQDNDGQNNNIAAKFSVTANQLDIRVVS